MATSNQLVGISEGMGLFALLSNTSHLYIGVDGATKCAKAQDESVPDSSRKFLRARLSIHDN